jgi:hypothetical protein
MLVLIRSSQQAVSLYSLQVKISNYFKLSKHISSYTVSQKSLCASTTNDKTPLFLVLWPTRLLERGESFRTCFIYYLSKYDKYISINVQVLSEGTHRQR